MSYTGERFNVDYCPNQGLSVMQCGWQKCDSRHHRGPMRYQHYSITFVLRGSGSYTTNGKTYTVHEGEGFIILPDVSTYYEADKKTPWEYIFAIFTGPDTRALLHSAGLDEEHVIFTFDNTENMRTRLNSMCDACKSGAARGYDVIGEFMLCMSELVRARVSEELLRRDPNDYIEAAISYMRANYLYNISINSVATYIGIERSYLYRLFKEKLNCSPSDWLQQHRLERAILMMEQTQFSLTEIANSVGFYDASHFSKVFTRTYHETPSDYRKNHFCLPSGFHLHPDQPV